MDRPQTRGDEAVPEAIAAIFAGDAGEQVVLGWLDRFLLAGTGRGLQRVLTTVRSVGAVWVVRLVNDEELVVKALRPGARLARTALIGRLQSGLARAGFPCPEVVVPAAEFDGVLALAEQYLPVPERLADAHAPGVVTAMAAGLAHQVELLCDVDGRELVDGQPAWADWRAGTWPVPHDPVFAFDALPPEHAWLEELAAEAANVLRADADATPVVGHSDWVFQNVAVTAGGLAAAYDWDSLIWAPEPAVAGLAAGAWTQGGRTAPDAPSAGQVADFLGHYERNRLRPFTTGQRRQALAAARWVRCYNARCQLDNQLRRDKPPPPGGFLEQLSAEVGGPAYI